MACREWDKWQSVHCSRAGWSQGANKGFYHCALPPKGNPLQAPVFCVEFSGVHTCSLVYVLTPPTSPSPHPYPPPRQDVVELLSECLFGSALQSGDPDAPASSLPPLSQRTPGSLLPPPSAKGKSKEAQRFLAVLQRKAANGTAIFTRKVTADGAAEARDVLLSGFTKLEAFDWRSLC